MYVDNSAVKPARAHWAKGYDDEKVQQCSTNASRSDHHFWLRKQPEEPDPADGTSVGRDIIPIGETLARGQSKRPRDRHHLAWTDPASGDHRQGWRGRYYSQP